MPQSPKASSKVTPPDCVPAHGKPLIQAKFKSTPADFQVAEILPFEFSGSGEHLYLHIEKTDRNTSDVVKALKRCFKVEKRDIGVSGQKDKQAVTSQWFSVRTPAEPAPLERWLASDDAPPFRLLDSSRHLKKLRVGAHSGNAFVINLRDVSFLESDKSAVDARIQTLVNQGFPNYFGPQRFGAGGSNLSKAVHWLTSQERIPSMARDKRSMYLSAVRSAAFNRVLAARVRLENWNQLRAGELCVLDGSNSVFTLDESDPDSSVASVTPRLEAFDVHPAAPLIGKGEWLSDAEARAADEAVLQEDEKSTALVTALTHLRVDAANRATRAMCKDLTHEWLDENTLQLTFTLTPGVFATTLLAELFIESPVSLENNA